MGWGRGWAAPAARGGEWAGKGGSADGHLAALSADLLDLWQLESGRLGFRSGPVAVAAVVRDCLRMIAPQAAGHGIALEAGRIPDGLRVMADSTRLRQILLNLASNAVKYNRPQGRVRIEAEGDPGDGFAQVSVTDTGPGLTREEISRGFRPFERPVRPDGLPTEGLGPGPWNPPRPPPASGGASGR